MTPTPKQSNNAQNKWYRALPWWKALEGAGIVAAIIYGAITYLQWHDLRRHFEIDQRAWLRPEYTFPDDPRNLRSVDIEVTNVGKSPALRTVSDIFVEILDRAIAPSLRLGGWHARNEISILFPQSKHPFSASMYEGDGKPRAPTKEEIQRLVDGRSYLVVHGQLFYRDQFGGHWTRFCIWQAYASGEYPTRSCVLFNAVGDGDPPRQ